MSALCHDASKKCTKYKNTIKRMYIRLGFSKIKKNRIFLYKHTVYYECCDTIVKENIYMNMNGIE